MITNRVTRCCVMLLVATLGVVALASTTTSGRTWQADATADYVAFDRLYIPALALTKQEQPEPASAAMKRLLAGWSELSAKLTSSHAEDAACKRDMEEVGELIEKASKQVGAGDFAEAHESLEGVRGLFRELRKRHHIDYDLDLLTDFHETMEEIVKQSTGMKPAELTDEDVASLKSLTQEALVRWKAVKGAAFEPARHGLDATRRKRVATLIKQESEILESLQHALEGGDKSRILAAASQIRPVFAQLYTAFGDFPGP